MNPSSRRFGVIFVPYVIFLVVDDAGVQADTAEEEHEEVGEFTTTALSSL